jgi:gluconate kinase
MFYRKIKRPSLLGLFIVLTLLFSACSSALTESEPDEPEMESEPVAEMEEPVQEEMDEDMGEKQASEVAEVPVTGNEMDFSQEFDDEAMWALIAEKAAPGHNVERIKAGIETKDRAAWETTLNRMVDKYGADISPEEKEMIIDFLLSQKTAEDKESMKAFDDEAMWALITEKAAPGHNIERIKAGIETKDRAAWETTLNRMIDKYGADISPEEKEMIIDFLLSLKE